jgi:hypothetical protein
VDRDRYHYMNGISDPNTTTEPPVRRWDDLEGATLPSGELASLYVTAKETEAKARANHVLTACLERFVRALARLFIYGPLGNQGRQFSSEVIRYSQLKDDELGLRRA